MEEQEEGWEIFGSSSGYPGLGGVAEDGTEQLE